MTREGSKWPIITVRIIFANEIFRDKSWRWHRWLRLLIKHIYPFLTDFGGVRGNYWWYRLQFCWWGFRLKFWCWCDRGIIDYFCIHFISTSWMKEYMRPIVLNRTVRHKSWRGKFNRRIPSRCHKNTWKWAICIFWIVIILENMIWVCFNGLSLAKQS